MKRTELKLKHAKVSSTINFDKKVRYTNYITENNLEKTIVPVIHHYFNTYIGRTTDNNLILELLFSNGKYHSKKITMKLEYCYINDRFCCRLTYFEMVDKNSFGSDIFTFDLFKILKNKSGTQHQAMHRVLRVLNTSYIQDVLDLLFGDCLNVEVTFYDEKKTLLEKSVDSTINFMLKIFGIKQDKLNNVIFNYVTTYKKDK